MVEIEKKDDGKCLIICPPTPPDEDELIKETFLFLKHPIVPAVSALTYPPLANPLSLGYDKTPEIVTVVLFWRAREEKNEFRTFQIIGHFAQKTEN